MSEWTKGEWIVRGKGSGIADSYEISSLQSCMWIAYVQREDDANRLVTCVNGFDALVEAVRKAGQLASIASDWNLPEVEIDGEMVPTHRLGEEFRTALANASPKKTSSNLLPPSTSNPEGK